MKVIRKCEIEMNDFTHKNISSPHKKFLPVSFIFEMDLNNLTVSCFLRLPEHFRTVTRGKQPRDRFQTYLTAVPGFLPFSGPRTGFTGPLAPKLCNTKGYILRAIPG